MDHYISAELYYMKGNKHANALFFKNHQKAYMYFMTAARHFKEMGNYDKLGECIERAGDAAKSAGNIDRATDAYLGVSKFSLMETDRSVQIFEKCLRMNRKRGLLANVMRTEREMAERLVEGGRPTEGVRLFLSAHETYLTMKSAGQTSEGDDAVDIQCRIKTAKLMGDVGDYRMAGELYQELGVLQLGGPLQHHSLEYFTRAVLAHSAASDPQNPPNHLLSELKGIVSTHMERDAQFGELPAAPILVKLIDAALNDGDQFEDAVADLNQSNMMDGWKVRAIEAIRRSRLPTK